jgi:paraquat-inducible protein A
MTDIPTNQSHGETQLPPLTPDHRAEGIQTDPAQWIICEHCDSVYQAMPLRKGESAHCLRCAAVLGRSHRLSIEQLLALSIAACVMFIFANVFPVISISMQGLHNEVTLWGSVQALAQGQITLIALVAGLAIILAPALQIALLFWVLFHAHHGQIAPGFKMCMRTLEHLRPWSMLEVCLLGILVAIVKLAGMLDVHAGVGLWAMAMLMVLIVLIAGKDIRRLWDELGVEPQ